MSGYPVSSLNVVNVLQVKEPAVLVSLEPESKEDMELSFVLAHMRSVII